MEVGTGKMQLAAAPGRFQLLNNRPVCENCGGPLFVEDWKTIHTDPQPSAGGELAA